MNVAPSNSLNFRDVSYVVHPQTNLAVHEERGATIISHGAGIYVYDNAGRQFLDGAASLWCASLGYSSERLAKAAYEQMRKLGSYHTYRHTANEASILLSEKLIEMAPVPMSKVLLQCSGSEANDTAIKLCWYYHAAIGKPHKRKIIGRHMGYHGSSCASISVSGKPDMHADFGLPLEGFLHTCAPHYYRDHLEGESEDEFSTRMANSLEELILAEGPDTVAAFFAEPVMGAGGAILPPSGYFSRIQQVLRKYDVLFIADEVICGFGRTGNMWGSQTFDLQPDMVSCAKALSAGMVPISALMVNQKIFDAMLVESRKLGNFAHGYTYAGHPVAAAVAVETLAIYEEMGLIEHVRRVGAHLQAALATLNDLPFVGDVRGVGLIAGLELVANKDSRAPLDPNFRVPAAIERNALKHGLILRFIGNRIAFSPPLIITEPEVDELVLRVGQAIKDTWSELSSSV